MAGFPQKTLGALLLLSSLAACELGEWDPRARARGTLFYRKVARVHPAYEGFSYSEMLARRPEEPERVLAALDLQPGMQVADVGCGSGFYTASMSELVGPTGKVYAVDVQQSALEALRSRLEAGELGPYQNVELVLGEADDPKLPARSLDAVLLAHADFYMYRPMLDESRRVLAALYRALKPGGRLVVVQLLYDPLGSEANIEENFRETGFEKIGVHMAHKTFMGGERGVVLLTFRKPVSP